jgi:pyruvate/2-oxoglutarate dehydrogenase complex dihydrolipoamide dehydrogenase (E3) component
VKHNDLVVFGSGSAARDAAAKVAEIESTRWGGSCPNVATICN